MDSAYLRLGRRRKIRCVFTADTPSVCTECFARGSRCIEQEQAENGVVVGHRKNLRERVANLESLIQTLMTERADNPRLGSVGAPSDGAVQSSPEPEQLQLRDFDAGSEQPLLSLFSNDVLKRIPEDDSTSPLHTSCRESSPTQGAPSQLHPIGHSGPNPAGSLPSQGHQGHGMRSKLCVARKALMEILPPMETLISALKQDDTWWTLYGRKCPGTRGSTTLEEFARRVYVSGSVPELASLVLCYGTIAADDIMDRCLRAVDRHVLTDDEFLGTLEGLECAVIQCKLYADLGQVRRAWLTSRRGINIAQLMGLHRNHASSQVTSSIWWTLYCSDRLMSLMVGMPYAVSDIHCNLDFAGIHLAVNFHDDAVFANVARFAGMVIDLNHSYDQPAYSSIRDLDQQMQIFANQIDPDLWKTTPAHAFKSVIEAIGWQERLMSLICFYHVGVYLHMPYMLKSTSNANYEPSRLACFESARDLLRLYHVFRETSSSAYQCKAIEFTAFTAAIVLVLGLIGYGRLAKHNPEQDQTDWDLVDRTTRILETASSERGGKVAEQSFKVLQTLSKIKDYSCEGPEVDPKNHLKISIPFFGTISIQRGYKFKHISTNPNAVSLHDAACTPCPAVSLPRPANSDTAAMTRASPCKSTMLGSKDQSSHLQGSSFRYRQQQSQIRLKQHSSSSLGSTSQDSPVLTDGSVTNRNSTPSSISTPSSFANNLGDPFVAYDGFLSMPAVTDFSFGNIATNNEASSGQSLAFGQQTTADFDDMTVANGTLACPGQSQADISYNQSSAPHPTPGPHAAGSWPIAGGVLWDNIGQMDIDQEWSWITSGDSTNSAIFF